MLDYVSVNRPTACSFALLYMYCVTVVKGMANCDLRTHEPGSKRFVACGCRMYHLGDIERIRFLRQVTTWDLWYQESQPPSRIDSATPPLSMWNGSVGWYANMEPGECNGLHKCRRCGGINVKLPLSVDTVYNRSPATHTPTRPHRYRRT